MIRFVVAEQRVNNPSEYDTSSELRVENIIYVLAVGATRCVKKDCDMSVPRLVFLFIQSMPPLESYKN